MNKLQKPISLYTSAIIALLIISCTLDISTPNSEILNPTWDTSLNTHPDSTVLKELLSQYTRKGIPGVVLYVESDEGIINGASGFASIEDNIPMTPNHIHYSGSMTKTYTATAIMLLGEDSLIKLDETIDKYLPKDVNSKISNSNNITIRNLLNHRSGIPDYLEETKYFLDIISDPTQHKDAYLFLDYIDNKPAEFSPDERYFYSNTNYLLLAIIMDNILKHNHTEYFKEKIFSPFNLDNTYYEKGQNVNIPQGTVNSYWNQKGSDIVNISDLQQNCYRTLIGEDGILATSADYASFFSQLLKGDIVSDNSLNEMNLFKGTVDDGYYGFGLEPDDFNGIGHAGSFLGTNVRVYYYPDKNTTVGLFTNVGEVYEALDCAYNIHYLWIEILKVLELTK